MEKLLQNIVRKFIKQIDFSKIKLKNVENGHASDVDSTTTGDSDYHVYQIKYNVLTIGTVVTLTSKSSGTKYLSRIDIIAPFRSRGIGAYVLKHWFSGYYIMADNSRASQLYARMGKAYNKFTHREFEEFLKLTGMHGVYKLDSKGTKTMRDSKPTRHVDGVILNAIRGMSPEAKSTVIAILLAGTAVAAGFVMRGIEDKKTIKQIQLGVLTEADLVQDLVDKFKSYVERRFRQAPLYSIFEAAEILDSIKKARKAKTFKELRQYIDTPEIRRVEALYLKAKTQPNQIVTHDAMPWVKPKKYMDKTKRKETAKKIEQIVKKAEKKAEALEKSKNPKNRKEANNIKKKLKTIAKLIGLWAAGIATAAGTWGLAYAETQAIDAIIGRITRSAREREAQQRFNEWRRQNGVGTRPGNPQARPASPSAIPTPSVPNNRPSVNPESVTVSNVANSLSRDIQSIREAVRELDLTDVPSNGPSASPGEHGARFSGLDLDSKFGKKRNDFGVIGTKGAK